MVRLSHVVKAISWKKKKGTKPAKMTVETNIHSSQKRKDDIVLVHRTKRLT